MPDIKDILNSVSNTATISARTESEHTKYDLSDDFTLPDYMPAIEKMLRVSADIGKSGKYVHAKEAEMAGEVIYKVLYLGDDKMPHTVSLSSSFEHSKTLPQNEECTVMFFPYIDEISFRVTGPRKLCLKSKVGFTTDIICDISTEPKIVGHPCHAQRRWKNIEHHKMLCFSEDDNRISKDIDIGEDYAPVGEILACTIVPSIEKIRAKDGKAEISYNALVSVLYTAQKSDDGADTPAEYVRFVHKLPLMTELEAPGLSPEYECYGEMRIGEIEARADINSLGDMRVLELDFDVPIRLSCFKNTSDRIVSDAFATDCKVTLSRNSTECKAIIKNVVSSFSDRVQLPSEEGKISKLLDLGVIAVPTEFSLKKNKAKIEGDCYFSAVVLTENGSVHAINAQKPVKFECDCQSAEDYEHLCCMECKDSSCRIDGETLCVDFDINVSLAVFDKRQEEYISEIHADSKLDGKKQGSGLTLYYPAANESLWDIAKKYKVGLDELRTANTLSGTETEVKGRVMLIP